MQHVHQCVADLAQIMRRDGGRHTDGNARRAVDQQVWDRGWQHGWLGQRVIKVGIKVNRIFVDVKQDVQG